MFLHRALTSVMVAVILATVGMLGNTTVWTHDRAELAYNNRNLVRLHILANSDSAFDQAIKLKTRDGLIAEARRLFINIRNTNDAFKLAAVKKRSLAALAAKIVKEAGADYGATVQVGTYAFPIRTYPFGALPAGEYRAVRVVLGRGKGHNWWCVLFPPLCFISPKGEKVKGPVHVRLLILERMLKKNSLKLDAFWRGWARFWHLPAQVT